MFVLTLDKVYQASQVLREDKSRQKALLQMMQIMKAVSVFAHFTVQRD